MRRLLSSLALVACVSTVLVATGGGVAGARPDVRAAHCSVTVVGENPDGSLRTTPVQCGLADPFAAGALLTSSTLAIHYTGYNWTGSTLTILGGVCGGGWLNLPSGWVDAIASTRSVCNTSHYSGYALTGTSETTFNPGGNLTYLAYGSASVRYY
jgi:hypothetical protein